MAEQDGGPAFPAMRPELVATTLKDHTGEPIESWEDIHYPGMSLRDYFAAAALTGLIAKPDMSWPSDAAEASYRIADAMLAARASETGGDRG